MKLQTDPKVIATLASEREDDNWLFRSFLKGLNPDIVEVDSVVHAIYEEVASQTTSVYFRLILRPNISLWQL